jgi:hypothetical protein
MRDEEQVKIASSSLKRVFRLGEALPPYSQGLR